MGIHILRCCQGSRFLRDQAFTVFAEILLQKRMVALLRALGVTRRFVVTGTGAAELAKLLWSHAIGACALNPSQGIELFLHLASSLRGAFRGILAFAARN